MKFQHIIAAFLLSFALFTTVHAQVHSIGPVVGVNFSKLNIKSDLSTGDLATDFYTGLAAGVLYNYSRNENWGLGTALIFSQEGAKSAILDNAGVRFNYLRIPLKVQYFFGSMEDNFRPKVYVGPSFGLFLNGNTKLGDEKTDLNKDDFKTLDLGAMGGLGFNYRLREALWLNVDAAYTHGLLDVDVRDDISKVNNQNIGVNVGLTWGF